MSRSIVIPGGILPADTWIPPEGMRQEHIFMVSAFGSLLIGSSPGIPGPVAPMALRSLAVSREQICYGFSCVQAVAVANNSRVSNNYPIRHIKIRLHSTLHILRSRDLFEIKDRSTNWRGFLGGFRMRVCRWHCRAV